jgi:hypothetical protein
MKAISDEGVELDAEFELHTTPAGTDLVLHARYGGKESARATNTDYFPALATILRRLAAIRARIDWVAVDSRTALQLPVAERVIPLDWPMALTPSTDVLSLRRAITGAQRLVARRPGAKSDGGNNHKRIRIALALQDIDLDSSGLAEVLARGLTTGAGSVSPPSLGVTYRHAVADPKVRAADVFALDPTKLERALAAHAAVQNGLAEVLRRRGTDPRSPGPAEPDFDLAWDGRDGVVVAEVKSLGGASADRQLRLGLGQVLHYRKVLAKRYGSAHAVLAVEYEPSNSWLEICSEAGVALTWPPDWPGLTPD